MGDLLSWRKQWLGLSDQLRQEANAKLWQQLEAVIYGWFWFIMSLYICK